MHKRTQRIATICIILLLLLLFTLPRAYLTRVCNEMTALIALAEAEALTGGNPTQALMRLTRAYERHSGTLKLFLDHVSVDAVGAAIAACTPLSEPDALVSALNSVSAALAHLSGIESLTAESLL